MSFFPNDHGRSHSVGVPAEDIFPTSKSSPLSVSSLLGKYGPQFPRLTKSSRHDEIDAKEAAFKAFKVAYDRESGYLGYKVDGEELKTLRSGQWPPRFGGVDSCWRGG